MKRFAAFFAALAMTLSLAACSGNQSASGSGSNSSSLTAADNSSLSASSLVSESSSAPESEVSGSQPEETPEAPAGSGAEAAQPGSEPEAPAKSEGGKVLVVYFSATNTTKGVAERIAAGTGGDLYEITPAEPYTSADLNYHDSNSRSTIEMNDPDARPAISGPAADLAQYDIVFLGYPIWWGEAPRIMNTFVESCDFSGKTIVPFCTSGSSGIGSSAVNLQGSTDNANWLSGKRLSGNISQSEVDEWIGSLELEISAK